MKLNSYLAAAFATVALAQVASAQTTVVDITGATAFRGAAVQAIRNAFNGGVLYGFNGSTFTSSTYHIYKGSFTGITGTTIVRTSWNGSTEGARACIFDLNNQYLPTTVGLTSSGTASLGTASLVNANTHDLYFSDVKFDKTVYSTFTLQPAEDTEVSGLQQTTVGAVVFTPLKNNTSANFAGLTNISAQNFKSLFGVANTGRMRLSQFTGLDSDDPRIVYATGRNDLSGTRTDYLLESGFGPSNPVSQWKVYGTSTSMTSIQNWPTTDNLVAGKDNRSVQWTLADTSLPNPYPKSGSEIAGNGGFFSGGDVTTVMSAPSTSVPAYRANGTLLTAASDLCLVTYIAQDAAATAITNGAKVLTWNGVGITPSASGLSSTDKAKIQNGLYTPWTFEQFVETGDATADEDTVYQGVIGQLESFIGAAGLTNTEMAGVVRSEDGGIVTIAVP